MHYLLAAAVAAAAIPFSIFGWMMGAAALALVTNGENPRAVLLMPRAILGRLGRYEAPIHTDPLGE